ncbi:MAG: DMT family transporter [Rickettsiales bacterium]
MLKKFKSLPLIRNKNGAKDIILSSLILSILIAMVRILSLEYNIFFIVMMRNFFGLILTMPSIIKDKTNIFKTTNLKLHIIRSANGTISMFCWFKAVSLLPLCEAVALSFLTPIATIIASALIFNEKISKKISLVCISSFIGVLIILRPGFNEFNLGYLFSFLSIILWTISNLITKTMTKTSSPKLIVANMNFFQFIISIPLALPYLEPVKDSDILEFFILGVLSNFSYKLIAKAYCRNNLANLQPFDFTRLIFTSIIAYFVFGEKFDLWVWIGALIILFSLIILVKNWSKKLQKGLEDNS